MQLWEKPPGAAEWGEQKLGKGWARIADSYPVTLVKAWAAIVDRQCK